MDSTINTRPNAIQISNLNEMSQYLENLQHNSSNSIANALSAQLQVIKFVNSPELVSSSFDLVFKHLQSSIQDLNTEQEKNARDFNNNDS